MFEGRYTVDGRRFFDTLAGMKEALGEEEKIEAAKQMAAQATKALIEDEVCMGGWVGVRCEAIFFNSTCLFLFLLRISIYGDGDAETGIRTYIYIVPKL